MTSNLTFAMVNGKFNMASNLTQNVKLLAIVN